jgi:glycosyltransferase involved in cell wall biosynthesis/SAM-dependent methyltransferase
LNLDRIYDSNFYSATAEGSLLAARRVLTTLWAKRNFESVIDVGCGTGTWLLAARELGAKTLSGFEGPHIPEDQFVVPSEVIVRADLAQPLDCGGRFDLCLCLEVAEHLPKERGQGLVDDLTNLSSVVVFSGATPFQGGNGHVNEMWPEYWARLFQRRGYLPWTGPRTALWNDRTIPWWYRQNLLVFVHAADWDSFLPGENPADPQSLTAIHPENYLWCVRRERGRLATSFDFDLDLYYSSLGEDAAPFGYGAEFAVPLSEPIEPEPIVRSIVSGAVASPAIEGPTPVVSVIIPCYRQAQYLPQAVRSVLDQTFRQVEAIVVDDGSPDDLRAQLEPFAGDPRLRFIRQENAGVGRARNAGVKASRGAFLTFLDADDWLAPQFCERLVPSLSDGNDLGFVYCDLQHVVESEATAIGEEYSVGASRKLVNGNILPSLLMGGYFPPHTVLVRKAVLDRVGLFDAELGGHADWDLWLRISASGYPAYYIDEKLVYYRIHAASMSRNQEHMLDTRRRTLRKLMTNFPEKVAEGIHELTRSAEEQYAANRFLQEQLLVIRQGGGTAMDPAGSLRAELLAAQIGRQALSSQVEEWRAEAERLGNVERQFNQYYLETQLWIASQAAAKIWHEQQAGYWKAEARRLAQRRASDLSAAGRVVAWMRHLVRASERKS